MLVALCLAGLAAAKTKPVTKPAHKAATKAKSHAPQTSTHRSAVVKGKRAVSAGRGKGSPHVRQVRGKARRGGQAAPPRRVVQASPSSDRYREIQQALVAKGYLKSEPNGVWDQNSLDAMKRFQEDQKLPSTGRLNSLSLIALGLGPKDRAEAPEK